MSERNLDPTSLLFQSFRHSQGAIGAQLYIFQYMNLSFGIKPELHPNGSDLNPYEHYLAGAQRTQSGSHITVKPNQELSYGGQVHAAVKVIRKSYNDSFGKKVRRQELPTIIGGLVGYIVSREKEILGEANKPWVYFRDGKPHDRPDRLRQRVVAGKASFLYYYGRDGKGTGYSEFDTMYQDMWGQCISESWANVMKDHHEAVADREFELIGKLCLAAA